MITFLHATKFYVSSYKIQISEQKILLTSYIRANSDVIHSFFIHFLGVYIKHILLKISDFSVKLFYYLGYAPTHRNNHEMFHKKNIFCNIFYETYITVVLFRNIRKNHSIQRRLVINISSYAYKNGFISETFID